MPRPVVLEPWARADVADAFLWYEQQRPGLGSEFLAEIARVLHAIEQRPEQYAIVRSQTRRALVHRFPYAILYIIEPNEIAVIAVMPREARSPALAGAALTSNQRLKLSARGGRLIGRGLS
jgi:plasmid stabilization system protein ParE